MVLFLDCQIIERKGGTKSVTKLMVKEEELLIVDINKAIIELINITDINHVNEAFKRVKAVTCNSCNISDFIIDDLDCNLLAMDSNGTHVFKKEIDIII